METPHAQLRWTAQTAAALTLCALQAAAFHAAADPASPVQAYYDFVYWASVNRPDQAVAQFALDAVVVAGPGCTQAAPCIGRAAIRAGYFSALATRVVTLPLSDQRFDGRRLRTRGESILVTSAHGAIVRLRGGHVFEFHDGHIASLRVELDASDPQTAEYIAQQTVVEAAAER